MEQIGAGGCTITVENTATDETARTVAHAEIANLNRVLEAAESGFAWWRKVSAYKYNMIVHGGHRHH